MHMQTYTYIHANVHAVAALLCAVVAAFPPELREQLRANPQNPQALAEAARLMQVRPDPPFRSCSLPCSLP